MILKNVRLIPYLTEDFEQEYADIVIRENKIEAILPAGSIQSDEILDAKGKTLLPGLMDLHMHLYFSDGNFAALGAKSQNEQFVDSIAYARQYLDDGYTLIRDCGNTHQIGVAIRDAIARGLIDGPRVITSGKCITPTAKGNDTFPNLYLEVDDPERMLEVCRKEYVTGVDFLKYMATGSVANVTGEPGALVTTKEELFAIQKAAETLGTYVAVHCHGTSGIRLCIEAGIRTIEHASFMTQECIEMILERGNQSSLIPTLTPVCEMYEDVENSVPQYLKEKVASIFDAAHMLVNAERAGVKLGWGTDCSMKFSGHHTGYEFYARKKVGFTEQEILQQATINSAKILGLDEDFGTVKVGKYADLILVDGKPDEEISVMYQKPLLVIKGGEVKRNRMK